jgi:hypothetical protein
MRLKGQLTRRGEMRNACNILVGNLKGRNNHSEELDVDGNLISEWILGKYCGKVWTGFIWPRIMTNGGLL